MTVFSKNQKKEKEQAEKMKKSLVL